MVGLKEYIDTRLERLVGCFDIYRNENGKFLHVSRKADIKIDLTFWTYITTIEK